MCYSNQLSAAVAELLQISIPTPVAGAAYGIDAAVHRSALGNDAPTIAVLAGGVDRPYPAAHEPLLERIAGSS